MKYTFLLACLTAVNAKITDNILEEESNFWARELQTSNVPPPTAAPPTDPPTKSPTESPTANPTEVPPCGISVVQRRNAILSALSGAVSDASLLTTPGTPQYEAVEWLIGADEFYVCPSTNKCTVIQRYTMALFYFSTEGDSWGQCSQNDASCSNSFLSPIDECDWAGITCNPAKCVTEISFENNNVAGTIPFELEQLDNLEVISLEQGGISLSIPSNLGTLGSLRILDLDFNEITGTIPEEIYSLTNLEQLDLNTNKLTGTLSSSIGNLSLLRLLQLYENEMTGEIPDELGSVSSLVIAEFFNNTFTGTMPASVCANREPPTGTGSISGLTSDCFPFPVAQIECSCCTGCAVY